MVKHPEMDERQVETGRKGRYVARHRRPRRRPRWPRVRGAARGHSPTSPTHPRWARRLLVGANIVAGLALVVVALGVGYTEFQLNRINKIKVRGIVRPGQSGQSQPSAADGGTGRAPMTVLVVGSDTRAGLSQPGDSRYGSSTAVGGARSDTIILARVVPATKQLALLSIPRDLYVDIPGMGHQRINAAINRSPDLLIQTIQDQLGIDINHYIDIDFDSFRQITDAVGGVQVFFPTKARDLYSNLEIPGTGCYNLQGDQALSFVRSREYQYYRNGSYHQEGLSDLARIQRQQIFIRRLIKKAESKGFGNPITLNGIISGLTKNLTVDNSFSVSAMVNLAKDFGAVDTSTIAGTTLATTETTFSDGAQVLLADTASDQQQVKQFLALGTAAASSSGGARPTTGTPAPTTTAPTATTMAPSAIDVEVVNGSGVAGQAGQASTDLGRIGFNVASVSSAASDSSGPTEITSGPGGQAAAQTVASHIGGPTTLSTDSALSPTTVRVLLRGSFSGISTSTGSSTPGTSTSTAVPSTTTTTYALPGAPAGQPVPSCRP